MLLAIRLRHLGCLAGAMVNRPQYSCSSDSDDPTVEANCPAGCVLFTFVEVQPPKYFCVCEAESAEDCTAKYPGEQSSIDGDAAKRAMQRMLLEAATLLEQCMLESHALVCMWPVHPVLGRDVPLQTRSMFPGDADSASLQELRARSCLPARMRLPMYHLAVLRKGGGCWK